MNATPNVSGGRQPPVASRHQKPTAARPTVIVVELVAVTDPHAGPGVPERDPSYRLKLLLKVVLRGLGFRCVAVHDREVGPEGAENQSPAVPPTL